MKLKNTAIIFLLLMLIITPSCGVKNLIRKADNRKELGEYFAASNIYRRAYRAVPGKDKTLRSEVAFKMGYTFYLVDNVRRAEASFANAIRYKYSDDIVYLYYADVLRENGKYTEALKNYRLYAEAHPDDARVKNGIKSCEEIKEWQKNPSRYQVKKAAELNSKRAEFSPAFASKEGDVLYFNSSRENPDVAGKASPVTGLRNNDLFIAKQNAVGKWETPVPVEDELNTIYDEGAVAFSPDGRTMYFTRCRTLGANAELFKSNRAGAKWSAVQKVEVFKDTTIMVAHPAISPDGKYLYFVSDMEGGFGGKDIWRIQMENDKFTLLENLGADINTSGDEMFPYIRENGDLYFASNGLPGFGGLDIFKATEIGEMQWNVENLKEPINSQGNDFGITFAGEEERGFFSSNRKETKGYDKLWSFEIKKIEYILLGKVTDTKNEPLSDATIRIVGDDGTNAKIRPQKDGSYKYELKEGVQYVMLATDRGFLNVKQESSTVGLKDSKNFPIDFKLVSVSKPVQVNNIFYEFGKWTLTPESEAGIKDLAKLLTDNPNITMEIGAHTDMVGTLEANMELSKKRAEEIVKYLLREGIEPDRLTAVGYGETIPVVVTKELAQQYKFMKEGDVLDEEYILTKSPQEQEIINQINRRTEFKVLKTTYKMY